MRAFIVDTTRSPYATLTPVPVSAVKLGDGFWQPRLARNRQTAIPRLYHLLEEHGVMNNFRRLYGAYAGERRGYLFTDSDLYKWMEAAAISLFAEDDAVIRRLLDQAIEVVLPAQGADGYLNTYFVDERAEQRWQKLESAHELYCAGHLVQAAVAHHRLTGERTLLDVAVRFADYIDQTFRVAGRPVTRGAAPGHPEIEMALGELYRETGEPRYLALAGWFLEQGGASERQTFSGHAVRAGYFMAGATDYYLESGDPAYRNAIDSQWQDMTRRKSYITGGVGSRHTGEAIGQPYELPNERAYTETCAAIAAIFWQWRMLQAGGEAVYADWLERTLYNGFLSGVSLSGDEYFYINPLADSGLGEDDPWYAWARRGPTQRRSWYDCTCCPPNVQRLLAALPAHFYSTSADGLWVHLYDNNRLEWRLPGGVAVTVSQETTYPWSGQVRLRVQAEAARPFALYLRIPAWARSATVRHAGREVEGVRPGSYLRLTSLWQDEAVELVFPMPVERMRSHDLVSANRSAIAIQRGPLVYCLEGVDHQSLDVRRMQLVPGAELVVEHQPELLGGVTAIKGGGRFVANYDDLPLYHTHDTPPALRLEETPLTFIPYYAWANRGATSMAVWIPCAAEGD